MKISSAAFLVTGSEILDGRVVDTNSAYLAAELLELGIRVAEIVKIGDEKEVIADRLKTLLGRHDLVMVSGGLGPTTDDVTRDGVAAALGLSLTLYKEELARLEEYFASRGRKFFEQAKQQAYFPTGSIILANFAGSAAGFCVSIGSKLVSVTPGPPVELKSVWERSLRPLLIERYGVNPLPTVFFRLFGIPESYVGQAVIETKPPASIEVSYRAVSPEVHLMFKGELELIQKFSQEFLSKIDQHCVVNRDKNCTSIDELGNLLSLRGQKISIAELMPCGLASGVSTSKFAAKIFSGASIISPAAGGFGEEAAKMAAEEIRIRHGSDFGLVVSEVRSGSALEGDFVVSLASKDGGVQSRTYHIAGDVSRVRRYASGTAVDFVRRSLLGAPLLERI
jgi:nicotinamide-nucleotide amidase